MVEKKNDDTQKSQEKDNQQHKQGFASMPKEKVQEIARQGGHASAEKAGHEGMVERGRKGGEARAEELGSEGYSEMGKHSHDNTNPKKDDNKKDNK